MTANISLLAKQEQTPQPLMHTKRGNPLPLTKGGDIGEGM